MRLGRALAAIAMLTAIGAAPAPESFYLGGDLSYANEMRDCGAVYRAGGRAVDPFVLMKARGGNLARIRLWNDPKWTHYSTLADVKISIARAHKAGLQVLLDFHYSDDWADGDKQNPPAAWLGLSDKQQATALHDYTRQVLDTLAREKLWPELVQVGNETNPELAAGPKKTINWQRNALLLNAGLKAVRTSAKAAGKPVQTMLHIAQPENAEPWFAAATEAGVTDYDMIGLSYYRKWSTQPISGLTATITRLRATYQKPVMVVETAYPFTTDNADESANLLGADSLDPAYPATPAGQRAYLIDLTRAVFKAGGNGINYWAPDWVSTRCGTRWGKGSGWENAAWFDFHNKLEALPVMDFLAERPTDSAK